MLKANALRQAVEAERRVYAKGVAISKLETVHFRSDLFGVVRCWNSRIPAKVVPARLRAPQLRHHPYASTSQSSRKNNKRTLLGALHEFELLAGWVVVGR